MSTRLIDTQKHHRPRLIDGHRVASSEYTTWQKLKDKCQNPRNADYKYYGGRGIVFDPSWVEFDAFIADMGNKPAPEYTLDRRDNNGPYSRDNCRWATRQTQARNRNFIKRYRGLTVWEWAEVLDIKPASFHVRLWHFNRGKIDEAKLFAVSRRNTR